MYRHAFIATLAIVLSYPMQAEAQERRTSPSDITYTRSDVEDAYKTACLILQCDTYRNVSGVPDMLRGCWEAGYAPAGSTLLDVYEGKHKGLPAQPERAVQFAQSIVRRRADEETASDILYTDELQALHQEALFRLAGYKERGFGCQVNDREAFVFMEEAAGSQYRPAQAELARYLMQGKGCARNYDAALRLLLDLQTQAPDTPHLYFYLGYMCSRGLGLKSPNPNKAVEYYREGLKHNDADAINNLGAMYERGYANIRRNYATALKLYRQAAALGNREASANLQRLEFRTRINGGTHETTPKQRLINGLQRLILVLPTGETFKNRALIRLQEANRRNAPER